jgi:flagellar hook assembly protein FlgD
MRGQFIRKLVDEKKSPGSYSVSWDGFDDFGQQVNSGIYLLKITADEYNTCIKMIILK